MGIGDLLEDCISDLLAPGQNRDYKAFQDTFCLRCRNSNCRHARWVDDRFSARVATQPDRFFNPTIIAGNSPKYADLKDFGDNLREAMRLEIADKRGDWEVPDVPIVDGKVENTSLSTTDVVDDAVRQLARSKGNKEPDLPDSRKAVADEFVKETQELMEEDSEHCENPLSSDSDDSPPTPSKPLPGPYPLGNTPAPETGLMVGGGPVPPTPPSPTVQEDDWTPKPQERKIQPGATIKMSEKTSKDK